MTDQPPVPLEELLSRSRLTQLNVISLLLQAGHALERGNEQRALLLFGAALVAPKYSSISYLIQGVLTVTDLQQKLHAG